MKYTIEFENEDGKIRIETKYLDSARKFLDAIACMIESEKAGEEGAEA